MENSSRKILELTIRNIGVIDQASLSLGSGFNVITGETGAGKTMVLTGLNLVTGTRSDTDLIRAGSERLSVSVLVALEPEASGALKALLNEHAPDVEDDTLLLQRSLTFEGRSKATIGAEPATLTLLQKFANEFFVIHGQGTNHKLLDRDYQRELLDRTRSEIADALKEYREGLSVLRDKEREYRELRQALNDREREISNITRFLQESDRIRLVPGEWNEIEGKIHRLDSVEDLRISVTGALSSLADETHGAMTQLHAALRSLEQYSGDDAFAGYRQRIRSAQIEVNEVIQELHGEISAIEADPEGLDRLRERRAALKQYLQRYGSEVTEVMEESEVLDRLLELIPKKRSLLADLEGSDQRLNELQAEMNELRQLVEGSASVLTTERRKGAENLVKRVNDELHQLGLTRSVFSVAVEPLSGKEFLRDGIDQVEFRFAAHDGGKALPLSKGASGGELSRVMLAIELVLSGHREIGTLIFDEIDAGIGGETGLIIGERIARLAQRFQIIVITHLAQVAAWADRHFRIEKNEKDEIVLSSVVEVTGEERVAEIARMLSGQSDSDAARMHARELLKHAGK